MSEHRDSRLDALFAEARRDLELFVEQLQSEELISLEIVEG